MHPDRMPVIIDPDQHETWLHGSVEEATALLKPYPAEQMKVVQEGLGVLADPPL
ncbi:SOS response-associated peptidase family protein [Tabrizicola sp.]|uniref:SOS response-associated peptidase family protein n=1 Tax=Tabrizicola sp. TaxID=2005166 RepID=UPI003F31D31D